MSQFIEMFSSVPKVDINCMVDTIWGSSPDSKTYNDNGEGVPFYQGKTEFGDIYINEASTFCTAPIRMAKQHAILMSVRAPVGAVNIATQDCCIGRGLASITPKVGKSITMFVFYALKYMEDEIERLGTGSTFKAINKDSYAKIQMPDVDIEKQIEFVKIAEQADKSEFVGFKSQFIEMFGDQNTNDKGWTESLVKDEFKLSMGKTPARNNPECWDNGTHKWVSISDMSSYTRYTGDTSEYITDYAIADSGIKAVPKGTIIMSFKLSIGRTAIASEDIYTNEAIMAFADFDEKKFNIDFLHFLIANKNWLLGAKHAVKGQTLNKESIGNAKIIIPPIETQEEFASIYNKADKSKFELRKSIEAIDVVIKSLING